jgi:hypothetical protein
MLIINWKIYGTYKLISQFLFSLSCYSIIPWVFKLHLFTSSRLLHFLFSGRLSHIGHKHTSFRQHWSLFRDYVPIYKLKIIWILNGCLFCWYDGRSIYIYNTIWLILTNKWVSIPIQTAAICVNKNIIQTFPRMYTTQYNDDSNTSMHGNCKAILITDTKNQFRCRIWEKHIFFPIANCFVYMNPR